MVRRWQDGKIDSGTPLRGYPTVERRYMVPEGIAGPITQHLRRSTTSKKLQWQAESVQSEPGVTLVFDL